MTFWTDGQTDGQFFVENSDSSSDSSNVRCTYQLRGQFSILTNYVLSTYIPTQDTYIIKHAGHTYYVWYQAATK